MTLRGKRNEAQSRNLIETFEISFKLGYHAQLPLIIFNSFSTLVKIVWKNVEKIKNKNKNYTPDIQYFKPNWVSVFINLARVNQACLDSSKTCLKIKFSFGVIRSSVAIHLGTFLCLK